MTAYRKSDLDILWFDLQDGVPDWNLTPHPRIWGQGRHLDVVRQCPDAGRLQSILLASHLLHPGSSPDRARECLEIAARELTGAPLAKLEACRWRMVSVPVAVGERGAIQLFLAGSGSELPFVCRRTEDALSPEARRGLDTAGELIRNRTGRDCGFLYLGPSSSQVMIDGGSLALPCCLGAIAAADNIEGRPWLATGALDAFGRVLAVECLQQKLDAGGDGPELFLYPQDCPAPQGAVECVPVGTLHEAVAVMASFQPGQGLKIAQAERVLLSGQGVARELCAFTHQMVVWVHRRAVAIEACLYADPHLDELVRHIRQWTDATLRRDIPLGMAVLECLSLPLTRSLIASSPRLAWEICVLQMEKANHAGALAVFRQWSELAGELRPRIVLQGSGELQVALQYVLSVIGDRHNRYVFTPALPEDGAATEILDEQEQEYARKCARHGACVNELLGRYYGTLGQHYAFCGPEFIDRTMDVLDRAIRCFGNDDGAARSEQERDRLYQALALTSAGRTEPARAILQSLDGLWTQQDWNLERMNGFQVHTLLRIHVDARHDMVPALWAAVSDKLVTCDRRGHPWQLVACNLGRLAPTRELGRDLFRLSVDLCLHENSGPTVRIMALQPLALLQQQGDTLPNMEEFVCQALQPVRDGDLSATHFQKLLDAGDWVDVLLVTWREMERLFPYSYR